VCGRRPRSASGAPPGPGARAGQPSRLNVAGHGPLRAAAPRGGARGGAAHGPAPAGPAPRARRRLDAGRNRGRRARPWGPGMLARGRDAAAPPPTAAARPPSGPGRGTVPCWRCHVGGAMLAPDRRPRAPRSPASHTTRVRDLGRVPTTCCIRRRGARLAHRLAAVRGAASVAAGLAAATSDSNAYYKPFSGTAARAAIPSSDSANIETRRMAAVSASEARLGDISKAQVTRSGVRWRAGWPTRPRAGQPRAPGRPQGRLDAGFDGARGASCKVQPP
jgi:hypothetical protein